jgi:hypothetical protein
VGMDLPLITFDISNLDVEAKLILSLLLKCKKLLCDE